MHVFLFKKKLALILSKYLELQEILCEIEMIGDTHYLASNASEKYCFLKTEITASQVLVCILCIPIR